MIIVGNRTATSIIFCPTLSKRSALTRLIPRLQLNGFGAFAWDLYCAALHL
jgi:hypothetical protein